MSVGSNWANSDADIEAQLAHGDEIRRAGHGRRGQGREARCGNPDHTTTISNYSRAMWHSNAIGLGDNKSCPGSWHFPNFVE